jgi:hypothetical protein
MRGMNRFENKKSLKSPIVPLRAPLCFEWLYDFLFISGLLYSNAPRCECG